VVVKTGENESDDSDLAQQSLTLVLVKPFTNTYVMQMDLSSRLTQLIKIWSP